jgi:hypothetical protein
MDVKQEEELRKQKEERKKTLDDLAQKMISKSGFNQGDMRIQVKENRVGEPTLFVAPGVDLHNLPDGWQYEANYMLDGDYAKEGIWRWKDGKREFLPIEHESNKSQVVKYTSPEDVVDAILAENSHIDKSQIYFDRNTNTIMATGVLNDIKMPQGLEKQDGKIIDFNDYGKEYNIQKVFANDVSLDAMMSGTGDFNKSGVRENVAQTPYHEEILSQYKKVEGEGATIQQYGMSLFDFRRMKYAEEYYQINDDGTISTKTGKDGDYSSTGTERVPNAPLVEATLELNKIWIDAYMTVYGSKNERDFEAGAFEAFEGKDVFFENMMQKVKTSSSKKFSEMMLELLDNEDVINNIQDFKVFACFMTNAQVANVLGIEGVSEATSSKVVGAIDEYVNNLLRQHGVETLADLSDSMFGSDFVREMKKNNTQS